MTLESADFRNYTLDDWSSLSIFKTITISPPFLKHDEYSIEVWCLTEKVTDLIVKSPLVPKRARRRQNYSSQSFLLKAAKSRTPPGCCWPRWRTSPWTRGSPLWREAGGRLAKEVDGLQGHWPPVQTSCSCTQSVWSQPPPPRGMIGPREEGGTMKTRKSGYVLNICARKWSTYLEPSHLVIVPCFLGTWQPLGWGLASVRGVPWAGVCLDKEAAAADLPRASTEWSRRGDGWQQQLQRRRKTVCPRGGAVWCGPPPPPPRGKAVD